MNSETGQFYYGEAEIEAARTRGEKIIELSPGICRKLSAIEAAFEGRQECFEDMLARRFAEMEKR